MLFIFKILIKKRRPETLARSPIPTNFSHTRGLLGSNFKPFPDLWKKVYTNYMFCCNPYSIILNFHN